jgi:hypothetical protein
MPVGWRRGSLAGEAFESHGELRAARAWSTMKVPVIVASITSGRADWHDVDLAITDFEAAKELASKHVPQHQDSPQLRAAGD